MSSEKQFLKVLKYCKPDIANIKLTPLTPAWQRQWQDDLYIFWSTKPVPVQPEIHTETLSKTGKKKVSLKNNMT